MSKHTPGRWTFEPRDVEWTGMGGFYGPDRAPICHFGDCEQYYPTQGEPPSEADGRLIAAAPDLLDALRSLLLAADESWEEAGAGYDWPEACLQARAAIAKAEGSK